MAEGVVSFTCEGASGTLLSKCSKPAPAKLPVELELLRMLLRMLYRLPKVEPDMPISPCWPISFPSSDTCKPLRCRRCKFGKSTAKRVVDMNTHFAQYTHFFAASGCARFDACWSRLMLCSKLSLLQIHIRECPTRDALIDEAPTQTR